MDSLPPLAQEAFPDTLIRKDITHLYLGKWHKVPNFLESDFGRFNEKEEYVQKGTVRIYFRWPRLYPFELREEKLGAFTLFTPRDFSVPGLEVKIEMVDDRAEEIRKKSLAQEWKKGVRTSLQRMRAPLESRHGLVHVTIPLPLPKTVERIIGRGEETNIDISGRESITFSGQSTRVSPYIGVEGQKRQPLFPSLDMKQELDVRLQGTIGEKINVQVDHSSSAIAENRNRIRLNYKGFDDDVVKLIELGNTNLSLPGSQLMSFSSASKGLFGVKALAQAGPVDLTVIASKQEGEVSSASFTPRGAAFGQIESKTIQDIDYVKNKYFFVDKPIKGVFFAPREGMVEVFESVYDWERNANPDMVTFYGRAWVDTDGHGTDIKKAVNALKAGGTPAPYQERNFKLLNLGEDYRFVLNSEDESILGIELVGTINSDRVLAVRYVNELGDTIGSYNDFTDTLALEIIKPANPLPTDEFGYTWSFMMRHIYNLGLSNIDASSIDLQIEDTKPGLDRTSPDTSGVTYLRIFGLDRTDESGVGEPDNRIDLKTGVIDLQRGILTFPDLRPFDPPPDSVTEWTKGAFSFKNYPELPNPEIYDQYLTVPEDHHKFNIVVRASSTTKTFFLDAFNILEGSEVVTLDGRKLARNRDYTIDYETGEVELTGDVLDEITPASRINIDYEYTPFAGGASRSLLGFNSLFNISKNSRIGTTWLYESKSAGTTRPRLGEESSRSIIGDVDGYLQFDSEMLTSLVNKLPLVDTDAKSVVTLSGEMAMSIPNPNTKGEAYVDDMEGVEDSDALPVSRRLWNIASPPIDPADDLGKMASSEREKIYWYNIEPELGVHQRDWNPDLDEQENTLIQSLDIEVDTISVDSTSWAGVMTGFSGGGLDLSKGQFVEIWINDFKPDSTLRGGYLNIELGDIDEDFFEPDKDEYNSEDKNRDGFSALTEDTGLDGYFDDENNVDINGDDYNPNRINGRFEKINGTERNGYEDDEDLDSSGQLDKTNTYFRFRINLADSAVIDVQRDFKGEVVDPADSWRMYRISLDDAKVVSQSGAIPRWEKITHLRVWFQDPKVVLNTGKKRLQIAGFKVVGNRWEEDGIREYPSEKLLTKAEVGETEFNLGVINTKTDPITYIPPFNPGEEEHISIKEQSLFIEYKQLEPGRGFRLKKRFAGTGMDFTRYRDMYFWIHSNVKSDSLEYFFKVAFDSLNFYEVTLPLKDTVLEGVQWIRIGISLNDLTNLKFLPQDSVVTDSIPDVSDANRGYRVRMVGQPSLFNVKFIYAGLRNKSTEQTFSGEIWMDDIYLGSVRRDIDYSQRLSSSVSLANVVTVNAGWRRTGPDFHGLGQKMGSGSMDNSINLNGKTKLDYFLPLFGFNIPLSGSYTKTTSRPKFTPSSDTEITDKALQDSLRTESITRGFSTTLSKTGSKNPLLKYTFDRFKTNYSMSQSKRISPSSADTVTSMSGTFDYQMNWSRKKKVRIFKGYTLRYWLNSISFRVQAQKNKGSRYRFAGGSIIKDPPIYSAGLQSSGAATYVPFPSLTTSFRMNLKRDVRLPHEWLGVNIGQEIQRSEQFQASYKPPAMWFIGAFSPDFNYSANYNEDSSPNVRRAGDPKFVRNVSNSRGARVKMRFDVGSFFNRVFRMVGLQEKPRVKKSKEEQSHSRDSRIHGENEGGQTDKAASEPSNAPAARDTVEAEHKPDPLIALRHLGGILSRIRKVNASIQHRTVSGYSRIPERPSLAYQLGFTKHSGVAGAAASFVDPERYTKSLAIGLDSGTQITKSVDLAARYSRTSGSSIFRTNEVQSTDVSWPDLNLSWSGLETFGVFHGLFKTATANLSYKKTNRKSGRSGITDSENSTSKISPSMVSTWKNGLNTTVSFSRNSRSNSTYGSKTELTSTILSLDMRYSFAPGESMRIPLPFFSKKIKFRSTLNTAVNMSYSRSGGKRYNSLSPVPEPIPGTNSLHVSPKLTYNFSRALNGSFFVDYTRSYSEASNQTTTSVRVGITAIFTF